MFGHVNELSSGASAIERPLDDRLGCTNKGVHRAVCGEPWVDIEQVTAAGGSDRIGYGLNHLQKKKKIILLLN